MKYILIISLFISYLAQAQTDTLQLNIKELDGNGKLTVGTSVPLSLTGKLTMSDSATFSTKAYRQKLADSVNALLVGKLATNGNGSALTGLTDSVILSTRAYRQKLADSLGAIKQATLVSGSNIKTVNGNSLLGSTDIVTTRKVASADIAATASATSTTTLFTPSANGMYRLSIYMKITVTGTSPVAGPVTITYTEPDGSVAQSHVMALNSTTGTIVTTTVNNSTTTGTVNGSMIFNAKSGVAIQYAIAVSGTFGSGRYTAHLTLESL